MASSTMQSILRLLLLLSMLNCLIRATQAYKDRMQGYAYKVRMQEHAKDCEQAEISNRRVLLRIAEDDVVDGDADDDDDDVASNDVLRPLEEIDLNKLSREQLQQLLHLVAAQHITPNENLNYDDLETDERGTKRPWRKVQRIIRRQLIKIPKRYLKKFLHQWGLARSSSNIGRQQQQLLLRNTATTATPVDVLMQEVADIEPMDRRELVQLQGRLVGEHYVFPLN